MSNSSKKIEAMIAFLRPITKQKEQLFQLHTRKLMHNSEHANIWGEKKQRFSLLFGCWSLSGCWWWRQVSGSKKVNWISLRIESASKLSIKTPPKLRWQEEGKVDCFLWHFSTDLSIERKSGRKYPPQPLSTSSLIPLPPCPAFYTLLFAHESFRKSIPKLWSSPSKARPPASSLAVSLGWWRHGKKETGFCVVSPDRRI